MPSLEGLRRKIHAADDLNSIVKTMKSLAMINIRHYEKAGESLKDYHHTVELGLQVLFKSNPDLLFTEKEQKNRPKGVVVFGSDQGLCGRFNQSIVEHTLDLFYKHDPNFDDLWFITIGDRVYQLLREQDVNIQKVYHVPISLTGSIDLLQKVLIDIEDWQSNRNIEKVFVSFNQPLSAITHQPQTNQLMPPNLDDFRALAEKPWPGRGYPIYNLDTGRLYSRLIRQNIFINLFRAIVGSVTSENASRLTTLQSAEKNIDEQLEGLNNQYQRLRQDAITEELLDIVAGFEVLTAKPRS